MTFALEDVLEASPVSALCVAIAALACGHSPTRIRVGNDWQTNKDEWRKLDDRGDNEFGQYLALAASKTPLERMALLAHWVAQAVDVTCARADTLPFAEDKDDRSAAAAALLRAMPEVPMAKALSERFDREDYFRSIASDAARKAILECGEAITAVGNKTALIAHAVRATRQSGWLPPEMRTAGYAGPRAAEVADVRKPADKSKPKRRWLAPNSTS
jgi:hypothetical protein